MNLSRNRRIFCGDLLVDHRAAFLAQAPHACSKRSQDQLVLFVGICGREAKIVGVCDRLLLWAEILLLWLVSAPFMDIIINADKARGVSSVG